MKKQKEPANIDAAPPSGVPEHAPAESESPTKNIKRRSRVTHVRNGSVNKHASTRNGYASRRVRYALVALGNIAQAAVLPGFLNARRNSKLVALVSDDRVKLEKLSKAYQVRDCYRYKEYDDCLHSGKIDAVYIALPNHLHCEFAVRAARAGIHVLSEKPLALDEGECCEMIRACQDEGVKLMTAYRLHFERANLEAIKIVQSGKLGEPRYFNSIFSMQARKGIRTSRDTGGGTLYDIGIYCINAARYLFQADPLIVSAFSTVGHDPRFREIDEMTSAMLRFPGQRLASFTCSFGAADAATYEIVGTKGTLRVKQAYEFTEPMKMEITVANKTIRRRFPKRDQFGPEIMYFSDCILKNQEPEPSGQEGLIDVHVIRSLYESARTGRAVCLNRFNRRERPDLRQEISRPAREPLALIHTEPPNR